LDREREKERFKTAEGELRKGLLDRERDRKRGRESESKNTSS
jgi:hypothetical protein